MKTRLVAACAKNRPYVDSIMAKHNVVKIADSSPEVQQLVFAELGAFLES
jgi:hypothetical protein